MDLATLKEIEDQKQKLAQISAGHADKLIAQKLDISRRFRDDVKKYLESQQFTATSNEASLNASYGSIEIVLTNDQKSSRWISDYRLACSTNNAFLSVSVTPQGGVIPAAGNSKNADELIRLSEDISTMESACKSTSAEGYEIAYRPLGARQSETKALSIEMLINAVINATQDQKKAF